MKIDQMREEIARVYAGPAWRYRVMTMSDRQIFAIYKDMERKNRFGKKPSENAIKLKDDGGVQLSIWDILNNEQERKEN